MNERARLKRESVRYTALFFVLFGLVFAALGAFVYQTVSANIFRTVDDALLESAGRISFVEGVDEPVFISSTEVDKPGVASVSDAGAVEDGADAVQSFVTTIKENPQIIYLMRDRDGGVADTLGVYSDYGDAFKNLPYDAALENEVYPIDFDGRHYRAVNRPLDTAQGDVASVQAVANVDSEVAILNQFTATLSLGLAVALVVAAGLSYLLSRLTLRPIAQAWERQTEFVQNASHELRTPLAVIRANQELLLDEPAARIVDRFAPINVTIEEVERLTRLTDELLLLTSADAGALEYAKEPLDAAELFGQVALAYEDVAEAQGKTLQVALQGAALIDGNRDRLMQLAAILLDNALKYTGEGDALRVEAGERGGRAVLAVSDTGVGIDDADLEHVFDRFYRADKARSRATGGSGLGLSIAKSIVDAHGGTIRMERNEPEGVVVEVSLPLLSGGPAPAR